MSPLRQPLSAIDERIAVPCAFVQRAINWSPRTRMFVHDCWYDPDGIDCADAGASAVAARPAPARRLKNNRFMDEPFPSSTRSDENIADVSSAARFLRQHCQQFHSAVTGIGSDPPPARPVRVRSALGGPAPAVCVRDRGDGADVRKPRVAAVGYLVHEGVLDRDVFAETAAVDDRGALT